MAARNVHPAAAHARAKLACAIRDSREDVAAAARAELAEANKDIAERDAYARRLVAAWPAFTDVQREKLDLLLNPGGVGHAAAT